MRILQGTELNFLSDLLRSQSIRVGRNLRGHSCGLLPYFTKDNVNSPDDWLKVP